MMYSTVNRMAMPYVQNAGKGDRLDMPRRPHPLISPRIMDILSGNRDFRTRGVPPMEPQAPMMPEPMPQMPPAMPQQPQPAPQYQYAGGPQDIIPEGFEDPSKRGGNWLAGLFGDDGKIGKGDMLKASSALMSAGQPQQQQVQWMTPQMNKVDFRPITIGGLL